MQVIARTENTTVYCNAAASFPDGVLKAHQMLHQIYPTEAGRQYFGISWPENGQIQYKAAVSLAPGEKPVTDKFEEFVIGKGLFLSSTINNFMDHIPSIQHTFEHMIKDARVDHNGYCLEEYPNNTTMVCMVPLDEEKVQDQHRKELTTIFVTVYDELMETIRAFKASQYNKVPAGGGWTPGQVVDHIIRATRGIPDQYTSDPDRLYFEKDEKTRSVFLNYERKMQAPESLQPEDIDFDPAQQIAAIETIKEQHLQGIQEKDLFALCLDFELPVWGTLTRYEWYKFISYHATRHIHQLKQIHHVMNGFS